MRSFREIAFRLRQEVSNLRMWIGPPILGKSADTSMAAKLPDRSAIAGRLRGTEYSKQVVSLAEEILGHRFRILGLVLDLGFVLDLPGHIGWRRDAVHQKSFPPAYFRRIPYLDFERAGDHKIIWELNRHQHLVILAQAFLFTDRQDFLDEIEHQLTTWWEQNPFLRGMNWCSALEVALRALSWMWTDHLAGKQLPVRDRLMESLHQHGGYLETNLSVYFSPNTHLLGEAVALEALGILYPGFPRAEHWKHTGGRIMEQELRQQVRPDGSHFEQSSHYQVYALDFFLLHRVLAGGTPDQDLRLGCMAEYLESLMGPSRVLPLLGDDDGGRVFGLPSGCTIAGRGSLATAAALLRQNPPLSLHTEDLTEQAVWWLGADILDQPDRGAPQNQSRLYADAGIAVMRAADVQVLIDGGRFGVGTAGHSHSDTLSLILRAGDEEILVDAGTYTYVSDPRLRNWFRGSAAHNTIRVDRRDQAVPVNMFRWAEPPAVELLAWTTTEDLDYFVGACRWAGFEHRRRVVFLKHHLVLLVLDDVQGPPGEHLSEQFWHFASPPLHEAERRYRIGREGAMWFSAAAQGGEVELTEGGEHGWRSTVLGQKAPAPVMRVFERGPLPVRWATGFGLGPRQAVVPDLIPDLIIVSVEDSVYLTAGEINVCLFDRSAEIVGSVHGSNLSNPV